MPKKLRYSVASYRRILATSDVVSLHLRFNDHTRACVTTDDLEHMKSDALLLNISRSELIGKSTRHYVLTAVRINELP